MASLVLPTDNVPRLNIVMLVVGTRGDVQPFLAYGKELQTARHRVRLATHEKFRDIVLDNEIEFYPLAGNPDELMEYMIHNGGIFPSISAFCTGEVWKNERTVGEILGSTWRACISDDEESGVPFVADVIIANPPSFGHIHCAEKLGIPLHIVFTMPWSETVRYPHPLALSHRRHNRNERENRQTYAYINYFTWVGTCIVINHFRTNILQLAPLRDDQALSMMNDVPHTYCWSPSLAPKPQDWGDHIDVCGFFFLGPSNYEPSQDLRDFLANGSRPLYIGFGSVVGHDQHHLFKIVREALKKTGRRAVVCNKLATERDVSRDDRSFIFPIGNCSHDWLFQQVDGVCHHGGAGTTAAGLRAGLPTIVVAFFGDQFFWGQVVENIGAGPSWLSGKKLKTRELVNAINYISTNEQVRERAEEISQQIRDEQGCEAALRTFYAQLPLDRMRSDLESTFAACLRIPKYNLQVSLPVAEVLLEAERITTDQLIPLVTKEWNLTNSNDHPTRLQLRIPGNEVPYSEEECQLILNNFDRIVDYALANSQELSTINIQLYTS